MSRLLLCRASDILILIASNRLFVLLYFQNHRPSYKHASNYLEMFSKPSALSIATGRLLVFISGSLGTLLLALAAINDAILLHVKIGSWNLLWYAGVLGAAFSIGKSLLPKATNPYCGYYRRNLSMDMNAELEKIATHTHYFPEEWRGRACDDATKKAFSEMFQFKAAHFAREILSIVVAPLILCISLPRSADGLCNFVRDSKVEVPGAGEVVGYSTFDFDVFEDENWADKGTLDEASWGESNSQQGGRERKLKNGRPKSKHGKMEKSFFTFKVCVKTKYCLSSPVSNTYSLVLPCLTSDSERLSKLEASSIWEKLGRYGRNIPPTTRKCTGPRTTTPHSGCCCSATYLAKT